MEKQEKRFITLAEARGEKPLAPVQAPDTDPQGSWTGVPENPMDTPVQDADDL